MLRQRAVSATSDTRQRGLVRHALVEPTFESTLRLHRTAWILQPRQHGLRLTEGREQAVASTVPRLRSTCGPAAVSWLVVPHVVPAFDGQRGPIAVRPSPRFEGVEGIPLGAYTDSTGTVVAVSRCARVAASIAHVRPAAVQTTWPMTRATDDGLAVRGVCLSQSLASVAAAGLRATTTQRRGVDDLLLTASTSTEPRGTTVDRGHAHQGEATVDGTDVIEQSHSQLFWQITPGNAR